MSGPPPFHCPFTSSTRERSNSEPIPRKTRPDATSREHRPIFHHPTGPAQGSGNRLHRFAGTFSHFDGEQPATAEPEYGIPRPVVPSRSADRWNPSSKVVAPQRLGHVDRLVLSIVLAMVAMSAGCEYSYAGTSSGG